MSPTDPPPPSPPGGPPPSGPPGYEVAAGRITGFAGVVDGSATEVEELRGLVPRFAGWNHPLGGVPLIGVAFARRFDRVCDEWSGCAGILAGVLRDDGRKLSKAAENYVAAERASTMTAPG